MSSIFDYFMNIKKPRRFKKPTGFVLLFLSAARSDGSGGDPADQCVAAGFSDRNGLPEFCVGAAGSESEPAIH